MAGFRLRLERPDPIRLPVEIDGQQRDLFLRPFSLSDMSALERLKDGATEWFDRVDEGDVDVAIKVVSRQLINGDSLAVELGEIDVETALNKCITPGQGQMQAMLLPVMTAYMASMPSVKKKKVWTLSKRKTRILILTTSLFAFCGGLAAGYGNLIAFLLSLLDKL